MAALKRGHVARDDDVVGPAEVGVEHVGREDFHALVDRGLFRPAAGGGEHARTVEQRHAGVVELPGQRQAVEAASARQIQDARVGAFLHEASEEGGDVFGGRSGEGGGVEGEGVPEFLSCGLGVAVEDGAAVADGLCEAAHGVPDGGVADDARGVADVAVAAGHEVGVGEGGKAVFAAVFSRRPRAVTASGRMAVLRPGADDCRPAAGLAAEGGERAISMAAFTMAPTGTPEKV